MRRSTVPSLPFLSVFPALGIFRFEKSFYVEVFDFQIELRAKYFDFFWLGDCLGYFLKIWAFFQSSGHPAKGIIYGLKFLTKSAFGPNGRRLLQVYGIARNQGILAEWKGSVQMTSSLR
jgi:hypothetical protein